MEKTDGSQRVRCLFGTDGVRDVANRGSMTPEMALRLGRAYVLFLTERGEPRPKIVVGRDTRRSGLMLENALTAGMTSAGAEVVRLGVLPTPAVSLAVAAFGAQGGGIISASHNPPEYNGIKFLNGAGQKLRDSDELAIEDYLGDELIDDWRPTGASVGEILSDNSFAVEYAEHSLSVLAGDDLSNMKIVFDCANGAQSVVMEPFLRRLKCRALIIGHKPNGLNINEKSGVMHLETLKNAVKESGFDLGIAFDGDADRVLMVDRLGRVIDGDVILWVLGTWLKREDLLGSGVVATVMSNGALERQLSKEDIQVFRCAVGDRYVLDMMRSTASRLGGEQSGHVIVDAFTKTGDGLCIAMAFLRACREMGWQTTGLSDEFHPFPQRLVNICVADRDRAMESPAVKSAVDQANRDLGTSGRVLLRASGTEPLIRLLVECDDPDQLLQTSQVLEKLIREA